MTRKEITDYLMDTYSIQWESAYHYASKAEWNLMLAGSHCREDIKSDQLYV